MRIFASLFSRKNKNRKEQPIPAEPETTEPQQGPAEKSEAVEQSEPAAPKMDFSRILTSQLVAFWLETGRDEYRDEYLRRMRICDLTESAAEQMLQYEAEILKAHPRPEMLDEEFIKRPLFSLAAPVLENPVEYYKTHFEYPFSYIVKLSDEAEWHYWNSHERNLPDAVWAEIFALSDRNRMLFLPFATDLLSRGWDYPNVNKFSYNEQGMLDRYRWGRSFTRAAMEPWK